MICWLILFLVFCSTGCNTTREVSPETPVTRSSANRVRNQRHTGQTLHQVENASANEYNQRAGKSESKGTPSNHHTQTVIGVNIQGTEKKGNANSTDQKTEDNSRVEEVVESVDYLLSLDGSQSVSMGSTGNGRLIGGVPLPIKGPGFLHNPRRPEEARYATVETVQTIIRSAAAVAEAFPDSTLVVNDLCLREGGPIAQHGSHQNGRDADILFYYLDSKGKSMPSVGIPLDPRGWGWDFKDLTIAKDDVRLQIDLKRSWRFMQALIENSGDLIQRIFIVEHLRTLLLQEAERVKAPRKVRARFEEVTCQPSTPHDDHMHVRFFCTADDIKAGCQDNYPIYPWRRKALREVDIDPVVAKKLDRRLRKAVKKRTTSPAEARKRAGPMHIRVKRFLDQRESWLPKPHPGRPYCR
jgi:penicillin-insensitive murein endopeptidase